MKGLAVLLPLVSVGFLPADAAANPRVTQHDRAATRSYLRAVYAYEKSLVSSMASSKAAVEALASRLGTECPGVLAGAPRESRGSFLEEERTTARERGEANRAQRQEDELEEEIGHATELALLEPVREPALAFAHRLASLHWSHGRLTRFVHTLAKRSESDAQATAPPVCTDLKAWAASGYRQLSSATKSLTRERRSLEAPLEEEEGTESPGATKLLHDTETPGERSLRRAIRRLQREELASLRALGTVGEDLDRTLGRHTTEEEREQPPKGGVVIAHGTTAAGGSYTIWVQQQPNTHGPQCEVTLGLQEFEKHGSGGSGFGGGECLSRSRPEGLRAYCDGAEWEVEGQTLEGATTASVNLRSGTPISSPIALVPPSLGGPLGFYFQLLPSSEDPVSLTELDAQGRVLATVPLPHEARCPGRPHGVPKSPAPPKAVAGATIVSSRIPRGPRFQIDGELDRFMGRLESRFDILVLSSEPGIQGLGEEVLIGRQRPAGPLEVKSEVGCRPREYAVLYGLLKAPEDTVLAKTRSGFKPFHTVRIPRKLHVHGVLAYIALDSMPSRVIVRSPSGKTVSSTDLRKGAREARETCQGEAEP